MNLYKITPLVADVVGAALVAARSNSEALILINENNKDYVEGNISLLATKIEGVQSETESPYVVFDEMYIEDYHYESK